MKKLQPIRGTRDVYGQEMLEQSYIIQKSSNIMESYGYNEISTPVFEESGVFYRTLGDTSDIVTKETYTFNDRDKTSITLRPELTAGMVRAMISNGMTQTLPQKFYAIGPVFRHERPQDCRYRQFTQIDCEYFGAKSPYTDVETILMASKIINDLGMKEYVTLELNSLGDKESRAAYTEALTEFLKKYEKDLSEESKVRLSKNPLRILDSKNETDRNLLINAPKIDQFYNQQSREYWETVLSGLDEVGAQYVINQKLVRGMDYYCHTVFEFTTSKLGSQGTVLAGGRFDGLSEMMGGPRIEAIGFAAGLERLSKLRQSIGVDNAEKPFLYMISVGDFSVECIKISNILRDSGFIIHQDFGNNLSKSMRKASNLGASACLLLGPDELANNSIKVKNMTSGSEEIVAISNLTRVISDIIAK